MLERIVGKLITGGARALTGVQARWIGCAPAETQRIYYANHTSHADFVLLWSALPPRLRAKTRPVAARDYWNRTPVRRYVIERVFHAVLVDRLRAGRASNPLAGMLEALDQGESLILFPEGTRGPGEDLLPFKSGIFHLARSRPAVEIVPAWLDNCYRVMPKGSLFPAPLLCSVRFGEPSRLEEGEDKVAFLSRLRQRLIELEAG